MRRIFLFAFIQLVFLAACGGGGTNLLGGGGGSSGGSNGGTGGNGSTGGGQVIASAAANVVSVSVDPGPSGVGANAGIFNIPYISVTICAPGTSNCQTIDHIEVDTGSYGLRIISSVINSTVLKALPQEITAGFGVPIVECAQFGDGFTWGSVRTADLTVSSEKVAAIPMQVIGDPNFPNIPTTGCSSNAAGGAEDTVATFGANGIIGVGPFVEDCGDCVNSTQTPFYWSCPTGGGACSQTEIGATQGVANPVASFTTDNNGVILEMPAVPDAGQLSATGALVFGIGTQSNNGLSGATVFTTDVQGLITINYKGVPYVDAFIDSGSNLNFLNDGGITACGTAPNQFFCPNPEVNLTATVSGLNNAESTVKFNIGDSTTLFDTNPTFTAFNNVAAPAIGDSKEFDFGMPFFYGRNVFTAIENRNTSGGVGPYFAF